MTDFVKVLDRSYKRELALKELKEKQEGRLILAYNGGLWVCNSELITLLSAYSLQTEIVLLDSNSNPRKVIVQELLKQVLQRHQEILNDWLVEYTNISRNRM